MRSTFEIYEIRDRRIQNIMQFEREFYSELDLQISGLRMQDSLLGSDSVTTCLKETSTQLGAISVQLFDYWGADIWFG